MEALLPGFTALSLISLAFLAASSLFSPLNATAPDRCLAMSWAPDSHDAGRVIPAGLGPDQVSLTFLGHASFLIESPAGIRIVTDYNDYLRPAFAPEIATMNRAHDTHFSHHPDPAIGHVLRGWNPDGGPVIHDITVNDVRVRNIPTNIRDYRGGTSFYGNSIFVFEVAGLCIAHLGHLHHTLTVQQLGQLGQMDVVLVPVDGSYTMDLDGMIEVLQAIKAPLMVPMHYFSSYTLERFLSRIRQSFEVEEANQPTLVISRSTLPARQKVLVLPGR